MIASWPELSDLIIDVDGQTLQRKRVSRSSVLQTLRAHGMKTAERIVERIPGGEHLDEATVDGILIRSHCELQRLSFEFQNGKRLRALLMPMLDAIRASTTERPIRVVDVGCGMGFVLRWLAAFGALGDDVELLGCDLNPVLISRAEALAREEKLRCSFRLANAFTLEKRAHVFLSTGVIHHFRGDALDDFFRAQAGDEPWALLHCDIKQSWAAPLGAWLFHQARMREPLARHDGTLSAIRAHPRQTLLDAARRAGRPLQYALYDGRPSPLPILRTLQTLVGARAEVIDRFVANLGARSARLELFA